MKHIYYVLLLFITYGSYAQQTFSFTYDEAGNQKIRQLICINCRTSDKNETQDLSLTESSDFPQISFYPNPVQEELYLKWQIDKNLYVNSIEVYTMQGQIVYSKQNLSQSDTANIVFSNFAQGIYNVLLIYNNGDKKDLKIVKK